MKILILPLLTLALFGCGEFERQVAADAIAGVKALDGESNPPSVIASGTITNILAVVGAEDEGELPPPRLAPSVIIQAPDVYHEAAEQNHKDAMSGGLAGWLTAIGIVAAGLVARFSGVGGPLVDLVASLMLNKKQKQRVERVQTLANIGVSAVETIESNDNKQMKELMAEVLTNAESELVKLMTEERKQRS